MKKLYIGNLPYSTTEQELQQAFSQYGTIDEVAIIFNKHTGRSKGYGFIHFSAPNEAQEALQMDGNELSGRKLKVRFAHDKEKTLEQNQA